MKHPRSPSRLSDSVGRRLNSYALAASAAGVGMLALAQPAEAKIVYTPAHIKIGNGGVHQFLLDLNHDGAKDFSFTYPGRSAFTSLAGLSVRPVVKGNGEEETKTFSIADLPPGKEVGPARKFFSASEGIMAAWLVTTTRSKASYFGDWVNVQNRYLGLKFVIKGKLHYGWARLSVADHVEDIVGTLTGYAYETIPNKPIIAGKTHGPDVITVQPASLGHLARGASAIPASREEP